MNTVKLTAFTALITLLVTASAASFGSFASGAEKEVDGNQASFYINVFNVGEETYQLDISSENVEGARIYHPDSYTLAPSEQTKNPKEKGNWFLTDNGEYVRTAEIQVDLQRLPNTNKRNFEFTVEISAQPETKVQEDGSTLHSIRQVRTYTFNVETSPSEQGTEESFTVPSQQKDQNDTTTGPLETAQKTLDSINPFTGGEADSRQDPETEVKKSEAEEGSESLKDPEETDKEGAQSIETPNSKRNRTVENRQTGGFFASGGHVTLILLAGIATTALYLFKVM